MENNERITTKYVAEAWCMAYKLADPGTYKLDKDSKERAGYPIYRAEESYYSRICDLGCRLEVVKASGESINIWIEPDEEPEVEKPDAAPEAPEEYGLKLSEKIRRETEDFNTLNDYEKFILDRGYLYDTEEKLRAGYDRAWKASHGIMVTAGEFEAEVASRRKWDKELNVSPLYEVLSGLVAEKKITPGELFQYAVYGWCTRSPEAVVAYEESRDRWLVNNCDTVISEERARVEVCEGWGFEASRVHIIGTPYYDATDWQFIHFDCAHMTWLWKNGNLYQVYE